MLRRKSYIFLAIAHAETGADLVNEKMPPGKELSVVNTK
jgi:hypothetical protein